MSEKPVAIQTKKPVPEEIRNGLFLDFG